LAIRPQLKTPMLPRRRPRDAAAAALKVRMKAYVEMMSDLINTAEVDAICTPALFAAAGFFGSDAAKEGREYVETLYLATFKRDKRKMMKFIEAISAVMQRGEEIGSPSRAEAEKMVNEHGGSAALAIGYRLAARQLVKQAVKLGKPTLDDCTRCYDAMGRSLDKAMELLRMIWKIYNPKPIKMSEYDKRCRACSMKYNV